MASSLRNEMNMWQSEWITINTLDFTANKQRSPLTRIGRFDQWKVAMFIPGSMDLVFNILINRDYSSRHFYYRIIGHRSNRKETPNHGNIISRNRSERRRLARQTTSITWHRKWFKQWWINRRIPSMQKLIIHESSRRHSFNGISTSTPQYNWNKSLGNESVYNKTL